jgi:hypothetical protein
LSIKKIITNGIVAINWSNINGNAIIAIVFSTALKDLINLKIVFIL